MTTAMATGLLSPSLCALSSMVRGSLLLLGWILEQPQSSAWQDLSLETHTHTLTHTGLHTHAHTPYKWVIKRLPLGEKKCSNGFLATDGVYWVHMKNEK